MRQSGRLLHILDRSRIGASSPRQVARRSTPVGGVAGLLLTLGEVLASVLQPRDWLVKG